MDVSYIRNIRHAIRDVLEGKLGSPRALPGVFGYVPGLATVAPHKQQTYAKNCEARHWFDVRFGRMYTHSSSPVSNMASTEHRVLPVTIEFLTHKRSTLADFAHAEAMDYVSSDGVAVEYLLKWPGQIGTTLEGESTIAASGLLLGPDPDAGASVPVQTEPIEDREANLVRWSVIGSAILEVPQAAPE